MALILNDNKHPEPKFVLCHDDKYIILTFYLEDREMWIHAFTINIAANAHLALLSEHKQLQTKFEFCCF